MAKDFVTGRKTTFGKKRSHALNQPQLEAEFAKGSHFG